MKNVAHPYTWAKRRRFMYAVCLFCAGVISYALWKDMQSQVAETAVLMSFAAIISAMGSYVFGAAWQDVEHIKITKGQGDVAVDPEFARAGGQVGQG